MEALEYRTSKVMADPVEFHDVLCIKHLRGYLQAFEIQKAFDGWVAFPISCVLPCKASSKDYRFPCPVSRDSMPPIIFKQ